MEPIMLNLTLKWTMYALIALALFSALTALYMYYTLNFGACKSGAEGCYNNLATLYASGIGIIGFSVSAFAAYMIRRNVG